MRTLTVCNFVTVDGRYEDDDHDIGVVLRAPASGLRGRRHLRSLHDGLLRDSDTLVLAGRRSFLGNMEYWAAVRDVAPPPSVASSPI